MLWIALHLPDLPLQVFTRSLAEPGLRVVVESRPRQHVISATAAARALGVAPNATLTAALALAPDLEVLERDREREHRALESIATLAHRFSPRVSLEPLQTVLLEVESCLRLFDGLRKLVERLCRQLDDLGFNHAFAAAPTPLAATWLSEWHPGLLLEPGQHWRHCLDDLPIEVLSSRGEVNQNTLALLHAVGVAKLGGLSRLPRSGLARRQASEVLHTLARATGEVADPRPWHVLPDRFDTAMTLPASITSTQPLLFAMNRLIAELATWLDAHRAALDRCCLSLDHGHGKKVVIEITTTHPDPDASRLSLLLRERLQSLTLEAPVVALHLSADTPLQRQAAPCDLFGDIIGPDNAAGLLLDRLKARLGTAAVHGLQTWPDHRPEHAWRKTKPSIRSISTVPDVIDAIRRPRPIWLLPQPRKLDSIDSLCFDQGPERIESGWWSGRDIRRDYYVARTSKACLWWVFQDLNAPQDWYLHGYFG